jgi:hypothetical protein
LFFAKKATAFHEAGHAVMAWQQGIAIRHATILPTADARVEISHPDPLRGLHLDWDGSDRARLRAEKLIRICLAGPIAQRRYRANSYRRWHGSPDHRQALDILSQICRSVRQIPAYWRLLEIQTEDVLMHEPVWQKVETLAAALLTRSSLDGREIGEILGR